MTSSSPTTLVREPLMTGALPHVTLTLTDSNVPTAALTPSPLHLLLLHLVHQNLSSSLLETAREPLTTGVPPLVTRMPLETSALDAVRTLTLVRLQAPPLLPTSLHLEPVLEPPMTGALPPVTRMRTESSAPPAVPILSPQPVLDKITSPLEVVLEPTMTGAKLCVTRLLMVRAVPVVAQPLTLAHFLLVDQ